MDIRKLSSKDWDKFRMIRLKGLQTDPQAFGGSFAEETKRQEVEWKEQVEKSGRFFFAAEENEKFVSVAGAKQVSEKVWMLIAVYTLPENRGNGLARMLTERIIQEVKACGADKIQLMCNVNQKDAIGIYEKIGFQTLKTLKDEKMGDGQLHDEYLMEKDLTIV
jgi:predicted GNAT family acetyltransferase